MASFRFNSRFWRTCRVSFRRFRLVVWLLILIGICCLIYLDRVGLPGFVKRPLLEKLHAQGVDLQFSRLRLRWYQGIVAENVRFGRAGEGQGPGLTAADVQVSLNWRAMLRRQVQVDSIELRQGRLVWPIAETNRAERHLSLEKIHSRIRFLPNDEWSLDRFEADFDGVGIQISGTMANASAVREWKFLQSEQPTPDGVWQERVRQLADTLEQVRFEGNPEIKLDLRGDARDLQSFGVRLGLNAPGAQTPWGTVKAARFVLRLLPAGADGQSHATMSLTAAQTQTPWATATNLHLSVDLLSLPDREKAVQGELVLDASSASTRWASSGPVHGSVQWVHALTNPIPLTGQAEVRCQDVRTPWGQAQQAQLTGRFSAPGLRAASATTEGWGWWANLQPYGVEWDARLSGLKTPWLAAEEVLCGGGWHAPALTVTNLHARLYGGEVSLQAGLDVASRKLTAALDSNLDWHKAVASLSPAAALALARCSWPAPPQVKARLSVVLPDWTNRQPDWKGAVLRTLCMQSEWNLPRGGSFAGIQVSGLHSRLLCSNLLISMPDLTILRPEGRLELSPWLDARRGDFRCHVFSSVDPRMIRPVLGSNALEAFDLAVFSQPPVVEADIQGLIYDPASLVFKGRVAVTNFSFRGESFGSLCTDVQYSRLLLEFFNVRARRGSEEIMNADGLTADFRQQVIFLTNGFSTGEPMVVARAIGPQVAHAIQPFQFLKPPTAHVHGVIPMYGDEAADLHFDLDGGPFHWWKFNVPHLSGHVHWRGKHVNVTNIETDFYGGTASASVALNFEPPKGADFQFDATATNVVLQFLMADFSSRTNHLEGRLDAKIVVTHANTTSEWFTDGYGTLSLRDGLVWDIPLFGVFTPVLEGVRPGLGRTRVSAASCAFTMTNGVLYSDSLDLSAPAFRLLYRGTVDLQEHVNARVEAQPLHNMMVVGPVVSTALLPMTKLFEYRVTGTLDDPKMQPVYLLSRMMLLPFQMPFHPVRTLRNLLPLDNSATATNSIPSEELAP